MHHSGHQKNNMTLLNKKNNKGFTVVEAIVAIFILTVSVASMLGVTASSISSARYARNEITANYLLQEAVDSIRNSRDTIVFIGKENGLYSTNSGAWNAFLSRYGYPSGKCFSSNGCYLDTENFDSDDTNGTDVLMCNGDCPFLQINNDKGYNYTVNNPASPSIFKRWVRIEATNSDEIKITTYVSWKNDPTGTTKTQSLVVYLLNWQKGI